ncbi:MAG: M56 family metallopeptidase [Rhodothermales bacterium]|nr:M56 family metallopeptidase [Rhodothermales bacterium]
MDLSDPASLDALARGTLALLLDLTLKGVLLLAFAGIVAALLRRAPASARHLAWSLALCGILLLPLFSAVLPGWHLAALTEIPYLDRVSSALDPPSLEAPSAAPSAAGLPQETIEEVEAASPTPVVSEVTGSSPPVPPSLLSRLAETFIAAYDWMRALPWTVALLLLWAGGAACVLIRFGIGAAGVAWLAHRARPLEDAHWRRMSRALRRDLGIRRPVRLLRSARTAMPMTWGLFRPVVLLPMNARTWTDDRRRCVLLHELAHIKRWDCLTQTFAQLACAVNWFNPLVWIGARQMREEREMACDDYVLDDGVRPSIYATHLLAVARTTSATLVAPLGTLEMARPSQLEGRVVSILDRTRRRAPMHRLGTALAMGLAGLLVLPLAALRPQPPPEAEPLPSGFVAMEQAGAYHWAGVLGAGQVIELQALKGDIVAHPAAGQRAEIVAVFDGAGSAERLLVQQCEEGIIVCLADPERPGHCAEDGFRGGEARFVLAVPAGVHLKAMTRQGDVRASGLGGNVVAEAGQGDLSVDAEGVVEARTGQGDIELRTAQHGTAQSGSGDIRAQLGRTGWKGTLALETGRGDLTVALPADADADLDLRMDAQGQLRSSLDVRASAADRRYRARLGEGGRVLALHSRRGNVTVLHEGADGALPAPVAEAPSAPRPLIFATDRGHRTWTAAQNVSTRLRFVRAVAADESQEAIQALGYVLRHDEAPRVRRAVVEAYERIGCENAMPHLLFAFDDADASVRAQAVRAAGTLGDPTAIAELVRVAHEDADLRVRRSAERSLTALGAIAAAETHVEAPEPIDLLLEDGVEIVLDLEDQEWIFELGEIELDVPSRVAASFAEVLGQLDGQRDRLREALDAVARDTGFARRFQALGYETLEAEDLLAARLAGLDAGYVRTMQRAGLQATLKEMAMLKHAGVDADFVREARRSQEALTVEAVLALQRAVVASQSRPVPATAPEPAFPEPPQEAEPHWW